MSEYQYYAWLAIDRPLTDEEQAEVDALSSHIEVTATGAWVDYDWGNFKHNPKQVLTKYFDAFLYTANWGSRELMFRFPQALVDRRQPDRYYLDDAVEVETAGEYVVVRITLGDEEGASEWLDMGGWLAALAPLRNDLLLGDMRSLYLAWLANIERVWTDEEEPEPPLPAGLGKLTAPLNRLAAFLEIDKHLLAAAAAASVEPQATPDHVLRDAIARLPRRECDDLLWRLAQGELDLGPKLLRRLHEQVDAPAAASQPRRTIGELLAARDRLRTQEQQRQQKAAETRRVQQLDALATREEKVWQEVDRLIQTYQPNAYEEAVARLVQLRDLARHKGTQAAFQARLDEIQRRYARRSSLMARLKAAGLIT